MDRTPSRASRTEAVRFDVAEDQPLSPRRSTRTKKPPPITPRRFTRFFTPRVKPGIHKVKSSRKALKDLSATDLNLRHNDSELGRPSKRRKLSFQSQLSSLPSSPTRNVGFLSSSQDHPDEELDIAVDEETGMDKDDDTEASTDVEDDVPKPKVTRYSVLGLSSRITQLRLSGSRPARKHYGDRSWQTDTASFYTSPEDINAENGMPPALPFCTTSCNTNSLVAVGDEKGRIRLIESADDCSEEFEQCHLIMHPHDNAIMDLAFSQDDYYLATACGDQTCQIIDVQAQKSLYALTAHVSSIKRVQFQPGSKDMVATCSRDGTIALWDMRVKQSEAPLIPNGPPLTQRMVGREPVKYISDAHVNPGMSRTRSKHSSLETSITSLSFVSPSQPYLFATASSSDSIVKLWDMRAKHKYRNKAVPISCTGEPKSHELHRRFGIAAMAMSTDSTKFYTVCRDHTIYAYSTSHLILGSAPEMSTTTSVFKERNGPRTGLGPLYGFRHPSLQISTFYNRISIRKATDNNSELIAVGSSDDCAVLFPTAERYLTNANRAIPALPEDTSPRDPLRRSPPRLWPREESRRRPREDDGHWPHRDIRPRLTRLDSQSTSLAFLRRRDQDSIPIYYHGTSLVKGHDREVTAVTWSSEGNLITISDDFRTRCWRQDAAIARGLRRGNRGFVQRPNSGWASARGGWDDGYDDYDEE